MKFKRCMNCGVIIQKDSGIDEFCSLKCKTNKEKKMICEKCGKEVDSLEHFKEDKEYGWKEYNLCDECGDKLHELRVKFFSFNGYTFNF